MMHHIGRRLGLAVAALGLLVTIRPAHADFTSIQDPITISNTITLIRLIQAEGLFKCPVAEDLINMLNFAAATSDPTLRRQRLQAALACACKLSRELRIVGGVAVPWTRVLNINGVPTTVPDLANFHHTDAAQIAGYCLCNAIRWLRDGVTASMTTQVTTVGGVKFASCATSLPIVVSF
jgi:hypothetical protein